jgi:cysteine-rich repeat protein
VTRLVFFFVLLLLTGMAITLWRSAVEAAIGTCGNGAVDRFEQCDDGNLNNGDGCSSLCQKEGDDFPVMLYTSSAPPPLPALEELPLLNKVTQHGITWRTWERTKTSHSLGRFDVE